MLGMFVSVSLCMFTLSNALLIFKATATVCCGGLGLLKPFVIYCIVIVMSSAYVVICMSFVGSGMSEV